ncbi:MAG: type II toxin-antitoxin system ParD family antitoxin [Planctomycetia bacterium]|nr:type II toxin-antitoxin system ParD family antitoxin [Planctomycetia bacterium]
MAMNVSIPSDFQQFILREIATGAVGSKEELVTKALQLYSEMRDRHSALKEDVQRSLAEAERGEFAELDMEATIARGARRLTSDDNRD